MTLESYQGAAKQASLTVPVVDGRFAVARPDLPAGDYQVVAVQHDAAGNTGHSARVSITVPPAVPAPPAAPR